MSESVMSGLFRTKSVDDIVADQIRAQGYKCDSPQSAKRDPQTSKPDEAVWILKCDGVTTCAGAARAYPQSAQP